MSGSTLLALDIGERRIGVATARNDVRIAQPLKTIEAGADIQVTIQEIVNLVVEHDAGVVVVGLPRGLNGQETAQTAAVETFTKELRAQLPSDIKVEMQDEALTSRKAEAELESRGKPYKKADIDKLAATFILEDYINTADTVATTPVEPHHV